MNDVTSRKLKMLYIDPVSFMSLFKEGMVIRENFQVIEGIPEDAQLLAVSYDLTLHGVVFLITSENFDEVPAGEVIPVQPVMIKVF